MLKGNSETRNQETKRRNIIASDPENVVSCLQSNAYPLYHQCSRRELHRKKHLCEKRWESFSNCTLEQLEAGGNISHLHPLNFSLHKFHSSAKATRIASASNIICRKKSRTHKFLLEGERNELVGGIREKGLIEKFSGEFL